MTELTINKHDDLPDSAVTDGERISREGVADSVIVQSAVDGQSVVEVEGKTDDLSSDEFELFVDRIGEIIEEGADELDTFYPTGQYDKSYLIRLWYEGQ